MKLLFLLLLMGAIIALSSLTTTRRHPGVAEATKS
jgi:hypothetical protein